MSSNNGFLDAFSPSTSGTSTRSASTVRSRNRRLVSSNDDDDDDRTLRAGGPGTQQPSTSSSHFDLTPPQSRGATPSPYPSRGVSPLPAKHPSRATESHTRGRQGNDLFSAFGFGGSGVRAGKSSGFAADLLESSWSSLQSLASSVLGSDPGGTGASTHTRRKPSRSSIYISSAPKSTAPTSWGPSGTTTSQIGAGTKEERQALLQAKKREALLNGDPVCDLKGRHKRRDSTGDTSAADPEQDEDALVYIHHVQPTDTLTGVTIRYGCQLAVLRKANGFWPSDSIQSRKTVLLPVEACSVKGRRIRPMESPDLFGDNHPNGRSSEDGTNSSIVPVPVPSVDDSSKDKDSPSTDRKTENHSDKFWKHEAWVEIEGFPAAVEIGRVPRRTLGFFPRTRRKSQPQPYRDSETPSASLDISRDQPQPAPPTTSSPLRSRTPSNPSSSTFSPSRNRPQTGSSSGPNSSRPSGPNHRRQRSSITLSGPGVGTLDRDVTAPGPAPDSLNKFFSQHLPNLAPAAPPPPSNRRTSFGSTSTVSNSSSTGLENVGGAIEGWVRKIATRAKAGMAELQRSATQGPNVYGLGQVIGTGGMGDLIELDEGQPTSAGESEDNNVRDGRGLSSRSQTNLPVESSSSSFSSARAASASSSTSRARSNHNNNHNAGYGIGSDPDRIKGD
ncbi:putative LysM domain protein [Thermoascus aurantiacus ATCC 26904]